MGGKKYSKEIISFQTEAKVSGTVCQKRGLKVTSLWDYDLGISELWKLQPKFSYEVVISVNI